MSECKEEDVKGYIENLATMFHLEAQWLAGIGSVQANLKVSNHTVPRLTCYAYQSDSVALRGAIALDADKKPCLFTGSTRQVELIVYFVKEDIRNKMIKAAAANELTGELDDPWDANDVLRIKEEKDAMRLWKTVLMAKSIGGYKKPTMNTPTYKKIFGEKIVALNAEHAKICIKKTAGDKEENQMSPKV